MTLKKLLQTHDLFGVNLCANTVVVTAIIWIDGFTLDHFVKPANDSLVVWQLIRSNMNLAKVSAFVGHARIASTMVYVSQQDGEVSREAIAVMQSMGSD